MRRLIPALALALALLMAGAPGAQAQQDCSNWSTGAVVGTLGGAALGGFLGSQFGSGTTGLALTGAGVLVGGLVGNQIGKALTCQDQQYVSNTTQTTLESEPSGATKNWVNPDSGASGSVTPTETFQNADGRYCRNFQQTVTVNGETQTGTGVACRNDQGVWEIQA